MDFERENLLLKIGGRVQGVGFRPFVYRLALRHAITGWVRNDGGEVTVLAAGMPDALKVFRRELIDNAPPFSRPRLLSCKTTDERPPVSFFVAPSGITGKPRVHVPPDQFACDDCLGEMRDAVDRRYRYPFINCTQCGPRYTLIERLPYDRANTSMAAFELCADCLAEYENQGDRRFHAEPIACSQCGPQLTFRNGKSEATGEEAINTTIEALRKGAIVAVKGVGGYHLLCNACDDSAVSRLRERKPRPAKPLAVMFPQAGHDGLFMVRRELAPDSVEAKQLLSPERPIVLCHKQAHSNLAESVAPGLNEVGAMLPYSPLHHLLLDGFSGPLIATSGNISGEPVITAESDAEQRLGHIADDFLHHNRPIVRPADDSVQRVIAGAPRALRLGRGIAPLERELPFPVKEPLLAVGGHMKNTVSLAWGERLVISPHIGDLDSRRGRKVFEQVITDLQRLYGVQARRVICDAHPGYASSRWGRRSGLPVTEVFHHHAHASALHAEHPVNEDWLVFTWDGVGYGEDGTLWGGEVLWGRPGRWQRVGAIRPFRLPGGEAGRSPWRSALALHWEIGRDWRDAPEDTLLLREAWKRSLNSPTTTAAGRLFDAASAILSLVTDASFSVSHNGAS